MPCPRPSSRRRKIAEVSVLGIAEGIRVPRHRNARRYASLRRRYRKRQPCPRRRRGARRIPFRRTDQRPQAIDVCPPRLGLPGQGCGWRRAFLGPADANNYVRVVYDSLFRFSPDGASIEPKIAAGADPSADFKSWTIRLRKGSKWSDGAPFTADDIVFWYKDVLLNKDLTPSLPGWMRNADGTPALVEKVDETSVRFTYAAPATLFLTAVANADGADRTYAMFLPAHYLKKFHPAYTPKEEVDRAAQAAGFTDETWRNFRDAGGELVEREIFHIQKEEMGLLAAISALVEPEVDTRLAETYRQVVG